MSKVPPLAKISRPRVKDVLQRERLFAILDDHPEQAAFWITGPPSSGKTTLISSYIKARKLAALWYRLDEGDADPAFFFYYLSLAGKKAAPRKKKALPLFTPEYRQGLCLFSKTFFRDLYGRLKPPFLLVFDNYHAVVPDTLLNEVIRQGLSEIPEGTSPLISSRSLPPPSLSRSHPA